MKTYSILWAVVVLLSGITVLLGQSRPQTTGGPEKSNKRPVATETPVKPENTQPNPADDPGVVADDEVLKIDTNLVLVPVKVMDRNGRFIAGLKKEDFTILENNVEQEITYFSGEEQPFTVALVLDMSISSAFKISEIQSAAIAFIAQLHKADKVMVVSFDEQVHILSEPTFDRQRIISAIKSTKIASGTSLYEAVDTVVNQRFKKLAGRKAIVLFTDGVDTTSIRADARGNLSDTYETDSLIYTIQYDTFSDTQRIKQNPTVINNPIPSPIPQPGKSPFPLPVPVGQPDDKGTSAADYQKANEYLQELSSQTGGRVYKANGVANLALAFSNIADELRQTYSLGFYPKDEKNDKKRQLKVKVARQGVATRARDSYIFNKKGKAK